MNFISVTWSFLITSITIFFGIIFGLGMALKRTSKLNFTVTTLIYAVLVFLILIMVNGNVSLLYSPINRYISEIIGIFGLLSILAGIFTIKNWKNNKKIDYLNNFALTFSIICGIMGILSVYTLLTGPNPQNTFGITVAIFFGLILTISIAFGFSKLLKKLEKPYPLIISNFMVLVGFYFIMFAAFIPGISTLTAVHMNPLYLNSSNYVVFLVMAILGIFLCGVFIQNLKTQNKTML